MIPVKILLTLVNGIVINDCVSVLSIHPHLQAALIMQVLQLSQEQIMQLPPEQRQSIMVLKEQISRSQGAVP